MARQTKAEKQLDNAINDAYKVHGNMVQVNIMDLSKLFREAREAVAGGETVDNAVKAAVAKYRLN